MMIYQIKIEIDCPEIPGANGMGKTKAECRENLLEAIDLILKDRYEDSIRGLNDVYSKELLYI